jgi:hypothetical protein
MEPSLEHGLHDGILAKPGHRSAERGHVVDREDDAGERRRPSRPNAAVAPMDSPTSTAFSISSCWRKPAIVSMKKSAVYSAAGMSEWPWPGRSSAAPPE